MKYIKRSKEGILVLDKKATYLQRGLKQYINDLCIKNLSTIEGREKAAKKLLNITSNLPVYVNEEIILFPTKSIRNYDCVYLNFHKILTLKKQDNISSKVIFDDLSEVVVGISLKKLKRQLLRANTIYEIKSAY